MTQTVTITPKYVDPPKPGKKYGSLKTGDGVRYNAQKHITDQCEPGVPVTIEWEPQTWGGDTVMVIRSVYSGADSSSAEPPQANPTPRRAAPANGHSNGGAKDEEAIFVTGVVGRAMGSGQFGAQDISILTTNAVAAYRLWKAGGAQPSRDPRDYEPSPFN